MPLYSSGASSAETESDSESDSDEISSDSSVLGHGGDAPEDNVVICEQPDCPYEAHRLYEAIPAPLRHQLWGSALGAEQAALKEEAWLCFEHAVPCCVASGCGAVISRSSECHFVDVRATRSEGVVLEDGDLLEGWDGMPAQLCWRCARPAKLAYNEARDKIKVCSAGEACLSLQRGVTLRFAPLSLYIIWYTCSLTVTVWQGKADGP